MVKILVCEISSRDDKTSSCNHDMGLVIGGICLQACLVNSNGSGNKHKGLRNKGNILRSG